MDNKLDTKGILRLIESIPSPKAILSQALTL